MIKSLDIGSIQEVAALTTTQGHEPFEFTGKLLAYTSKRTSGSMGDASPIAALYLFENVTPRRKASNRYVLAFQKCEADGMIITASYRTYTRLEKMAEKSPVDKMHRRICELVGVRDHMGDMKPTEVGGQ